MMSSGSEQIDYEQEYEEQEYEESSSGDGFGGFETDSGSSYDSDFDPEALHRQVQTPRPSLTEIKGLINGLSQLNFDEEFMLEELKMDLKRNEDDNIPNDNIPNDNETEETKQVEEKEINDTSFKLIRAKSPEPKRPIPDLPRKHRGSNPLLNGSKEYKEDDEKEDKYKYKDKKVKHTDSLTAKSINKGKQWYINQYLCYKFLGKGAFGKVCLAKDVTTNIKYALKVLNKSLLRRKRILRKGKPPTNMLENIFREIAIMKKLDHPNVLQIHEVIDDPDNDKLFMVIDYMDNGSVLGEKGAEAKCDPMEDHELIRRYIRDMILGLDYLHANDIIHGDIKPENLLLTKDHHLKIADFGVSFMLDDETCPNKDGKISRAQGTPAFTAPETGSKLFMAYPIDVWAMGVTLYMMITGICPFAGNGIYDTYEKIQNDNPPIPQNIDENMKDFLEKILLKDPNKRITLKQAMMHPWITKNGTDLLLHPFEHNNHKFEKRVSVTKEDIETGLTLRDETIKHWRRASLELRQSQLVKIGNDNATDSDNDNKYNQGTKKRGSIEINDDNEEKEIVSSSPIISEDDVSISQTNIISNTHSSHSSQSESESSDYQITQQPPKKNINIKKPKKPIKKLPDTILPSQHESNVSPKKTIKKHENSEYNPFYDTNNQNNIIVNINQENIATYTSKPVKIELSRSDSDPITNGSNSNGSNKKHNKKQSLTPNPTSSTSSTTKNSKKIKSKKKSKKPSRDAPIINPSKKAKSHNKSHNKTPKKPLKVPPTNNKSKSKTKRHQNGTRKSSPNISKTRNSSSTLNRKQKQKKDINTSNGSRRSTPNIVAGKKKKKRITKTKALPPSIKKNKRNKSKTNNNNNNINNNNNDSDNSNDIEVESPKNISPSFVKRRRSSEKKNGNKGKSKGTKSAKKKGKPKVDAPKKAAPSLPPKNKPLPKSGKNKVKGNKNPTNI